MKLLQNLRRGKKGFTLIEIVIVLAIAALILVIVFLAIAGAQKSQRDNASLDGAAKVIARYQSYLSDNNNNAPGVGTPAMTDFINNYIPVTEVKDGRGNAFTISTAGNAASISTSRFLIGGTCAANGALGGGGGSTQIAVAYWSETANKSICKTS